MGRGKLFEQVSSPRGPALEITAAVGATILVLTFNAVRTEGALE